MKTWPIVSNFFITSKLEEKKLSDICDEILRPENCDNLVVPKVNPTIWDNLNPKTRSLDLKIQRCQKPLIKGLAALVTSYDGRELSEMEQNILALLANSVFEINMLRKDIIKPNLNQKYTHLCKQSVTPAEWLFGDDLPKTVKELEDQQKASVVKSPPYKIGHRIANSTKFMPYNLDSYRQRYRDAGWHSTRGSQRPFLGGANVSRGQRSHIAQSSAAKHTPANRPTRR